MINMMEAHFKTLKNLSQLKDAIKALGMPVEMELCEDGVVLHMMKNNKVMKVMAELYDKINEEFEYEFKVTNESDFMSLLDMLKKLN